MTPRFVDPDRFVLLAGIVDWVAMSRRFLNAGSLSLELERRKIGPRMVQLRWVLSPEVGMPSEAFRVWRRPALPSPGEKALEFATSQPIFGWKLYAMAADHALLRVRINVLGGSGAIVMALAQPNLFGGMLDAVTLAPGGRTALFSGPAIRAIAMFGDVDVQSITGSTAEDALSRDAKWELVEIVGLPVEPADWAAVPDHAKPQGMVGALVDPRMAALDRWRRGAPLFGWDSLIAPGEAAPPWVLADPTAMIKLAQAEVLPPLRNMLLTLPPSEHAGLRIDRMLVASGGGDPAAAELSPLSALCYAAATDPLASLMMGFGTAYPDADLPAIVLGERALLGDPMRGDFDYMVTALWARGLDGRSDPVELAALAHASPLATRPPAPANLVARLRGLRAPDAPDLAFRMTAEFEWAPPPQGAKARPVSYTAAQRFLPAGVTTAIIGPRRNDVALQTIGLSTSEERGDQGLGPISGDDGHLLVAAPDPNPLRYAVAHQDLFGVWSTWSSATVTVALPPPQQVAIIAARLETTAPAAGSVCPSRLVIDFSWDWAARRPIEIEFRGRFFAQTKRDAAPTDLSVPPGLTRAFPGGGGAFRVAFATNGNATPDAGGSIAHLSADGTKVLPVLGVGGVVLEPLPSTTPGPRRYRLTIDGLTIDHGLSGHVGLSIWARGRERLAPQRQGGFGTRPRLASSSDPRPPVITLVREDVQLASMANARGEHLARFTWDGVPGAIGYFVYHAEESKLRAVNAMGEEPRSLTLSQRLAQLRARFQTNPDKRAFARLNQTALPGTSHEAVLPRGTKEIHLFLVVGVSAGGVESAWPVATDPLCGKRFAAFAAPQQVLPAPPELEVSRRLLQPAGLFRAAVAMRARPGVVATRIDLHRVRNAEAALELDSMGPAIAQITGSAPPWTVTPHAGPAPGETQPLARIEGLDPVPGSWRPVFYRAVAWSSDDPQRGLYGGRSPPGSMQEVVVPPSTPPDLGPLSLTWPGGPLGDLAATATIAAPVANTVLGPHRIRVEALVEDGSGALVPVLLFPARPASPDLIVDDRLEALPTAPGAPGAAVWRSPRAGNAEGCVLNLRFFRADFATPARVRVLLTDPLGRASERIAEASTLSPLPMPDLTDLVITPLPGGRVRMDVRTSISPTVTLAGSYALAVAYRLRRAGLPPFGGQLINASASSDLDKLRLLRPGDNLMLDPASIPLRRVAQPGRGTAITGLLRGNGTFSLTITLTAPDGRVATLSRRF